MRGDNELKDDREDDDDDDDEKGDLNVNAFNVKKRRLLKRHDMRPVVARIAPFR